MAERILGFVSNLFKIGKEQVFQKSGLLRNKVPIKPVLGLTGLGVLFMMVKPLLTNNNAADGKAPSTVPSIPNPKPKTKTETADEHDLKRTLYLMKQKEIQLKKQDESRQKS